MGYANAFVAGGTITAGNPVKISSGGSVTRTGDPSEYPAGIATNDAVSGGTVTVQNGGETPWETVNLGSDAIVPGMTVVAHTTGSGGSQKWGVQSLNEALTDDPPGETTTIHILGVATTVGAAGGRVMVRVQQSDFQYFVAEEA